MNLEKLEIINQLEADMNHLGDSEGHSYARLNIKAAMRGIEDDNYRFACDRLGIAMAYILNSGHAPTGPRPKGEEASP